jgi:hypothetical protein
MSLPSKQTAPHEPLQPRLTVVASNPVGAFVNRLERVRKSGRGWTARCPAHEDKTASLSITAGDQGQCLVHCFAGCSAAEVVAAAGLQMSDLFVKRLAENMTYAERAALKEYSRQANWRAALNVLGFESKIVEIAARCVVSCQKLDADDLKRLQEARQRIDDAREVLCAQSS